MSKTDIQHRRAWKKTFDPFLSGLQGENALPFRLSDYFRYVDGLPRHEAVHRFLTSRSVCLPVGHADEAPGQGSEHQLANRKDELLSESLDLEEVEAYPGSVRFIQAVREAGLSTAVVSASSHCAQVLAACDIEFLFDICVDGEVVREQGLRGKPAPDSYLTAAAELGIAADHAAVFEDGPTGLAAAAAGGFAFVVAVDRCGQQELLRAQSPDVVVNDLAELLPVPRGSRRET